MEHVLHNPMSRFTAQAVLIVGLSRLLGLVARRFDQPMVVAEVAAGIVLGPSLLGWALPGAYGALFAPESLPVLGLVSQVGLLLFMFLIGLELDPGLLRGRGRASVVISHAGIVVPFGLGALLSLVLYRRLGQEGVGASAFALFLGAAMSVTAFPVLARILAERRLLGTEIGALTITCAAIDDATAWCILAFVVSIVRASGLSGAVRTTALVGAYVGVMVGLVRPFLARLGARSDNREGLSQNVVAVTLVLLLASSFVTEQIGVHGLFGAFMLGAIMPREGGFVRVLAEKLEDVVLVFLLPLFFAYSGLRTQIGLLRTGESWLWCGLIVLVACAGKFGGSAAAARLMGVRWREAVALGVLMNTRGLMELVVLNLGLDLGVISPTLFTMMVLMALFTTFMTSPLLRRLYPAGAAAQAGAIATPMPAGVGAPFTVLMCVAFERSGPAMATLASALSSTPGRLYALRLIAPSERASFVLRASPDEGDDPALGPLLRRAEALPLAVKPLSFVSAHPGDDICNVADVKQADLILLGWHKPLLSRGTLGGTVHEVMRRARSGVGVFIDRGLRRVERVLVPFHGTAHDHAALRLARRMRDAGARVTVLEVTARGQRRGESRAAVEAAFGGPGAKGVEVRSVEHETPAQAALDEATRGYDLVVVGVGPEWGIEQRLFGLQRELLAERCPASLLVIRHAEGEARAASAGAGAERGAARPLSMQTETL